MKKLWTDDGWSDYLFWQAQDKKTLRKINQLIKDIERNGLLSGIGKPENLKYRPNQYSRRIDQSNRLVYSIDAAGNLIIYSCRGHYWD